jgi:pyruvate ferredoxin oxidoreductase gamma subunit
VIAVRFHGRGGQGAKTASRILGTAAFLEGYQAQDSPIYGAERRGAPVAAYTRLSHERIRERGVIARPDVVLIADASLVRDPSARVLDGIQAGTIVFVNSAAAPDQLAAESAARVVTMDLTALALTQVGTGGALSALLGAAAGRLVGLRAESVEQAVAQELAELGLAAEVITRNQSAARHCYEMVQPVQLEPRPREIAAPARLHQPKYESPTRGTASITAAGNSALRSVSGWRTFRPVLRPDLCNGCWLCFANCPEGAITIKPDGKPAIYYPHCKGCLDCVEVCPTDAMTMERETAAQDM